MKTLVLGTRGSDLALAQTRLVAAALEAARPGTAMEERIIRTTGDVRLDVSLSQPGPLDKGLFTKELEEAMLAGKIDAAVHSLKDLPTERTQGLAIGAILKREAPGDVLVSKVDGGIDGLPEGARVATSSLRRKCFLLWRRPDLDVAEIRGNVPTRIRKLADSTDLAAVVLAGAGIRRLRGADCPLALDDLTLTELDFMLPAPGQGAIAVECRANDSATLELLGRLHDPVSAWCVAAERAVLAGLGGGCHLPLGTLARVDASGELTLRAAWFGEAVPRFAEGRGAISDWATIASDVCAQLRD